MYSNGSHRLIACRSFRTVVVGISTVAYSKARLKTPPHPYIDANLTLYDLSILALYEDEVSTMH
jgi:hypothetical protein